MSEETTKNVVHPGNLAAWLAERVMICDALNAQTPSVTVLARADAFREALEMLCQIEGTQPACRICGRPMGRGRSGRLTCSVACRVSLHRSQKTGEVGRRDSGK